MIIAANFQIKHLERRSLKKSELQRDSNPWPPRYRSDALPLTEPRSHTAGIVIDCVKLFTVWSVLLLCFVAGCFVCLFLPLLTRLHLHQQKTSHATEKAGEKAKATRRGNKKVGLAVPR